MVQPPDAAAAQVRLVCFASAGGAASMFYSWRGALGPGIGVYAVQLPGREERLREPPVRSLAEIVSAVIAAMVGFDDRPLVLFGHSFGAIVAFEVARQLQRAGGLQPSVLVVSGRGAPNLPNRASRIAHLPPSEVLEIAAERYGGIADAVLSDPELRSAAAKALRADLEITERYEVEPGPPLPFPIAAFGGHEDAWVTRRDLDGWGEYASDEFTCLQFPGGHFYFKDPGVQDLFLARVRELCRGAISAS